jgi:hypothetical protein
VQATDPGRGVSETLARERASAIAELRYELAFSIPADRRAPVDGRADVHFVLHKPQRIVFDFAKARERIRSVRSNGTAVDAVLPRGRARASITSNCSSSPATRR